MFVFGSNTAGMHGAGAAKQARRYGAKPGRGIGLVGGRTYAIPTKDDDLDVLPLETIAAYVGRFRKFTREYPKIKFFVTRIGCGLSRYRDADIAPLFKGCGDNCSFAHEWRPYLEN